MFTRKVVAKRGCGLHLAALAAFTAALCVVFSERECAAASKDECLDAHSRGQDMREAGQLTRARALFLTCAQSTCPALIQGDCARLGEELDRLVPSVSFGARDADSSDLPNTSVFVDDALMASRLDEGKSYDFDPGKHTIRFVHDGRELTLKVVLNQGEKGRTLVAAFPRAGGSSDPSDSRAAPPRAKRPVLPLVVAGLGTAALVTGSVLLAVGLHDVPATCSVSTRDCAAPPGDRAFDQASHALSLADIGMGVGITGAALLVGGVVWYFVQPTTTTIQTGKKGLVQPWVGRASGGVALIGAF